jgi:hypothetical protein
LARLGRARPHPPVFGRRQIAAAAPGPPSWSGAVVRLGDSISKNNLAFGTRTVAEVDRGMLGLMGGIRTVTLDNQAVGGALIVDFISTGVNYANWTAAVTSGCAVTMQIGTNDCGAGLSGADYSTHMAEIAAAALALGAACFIPHYVPYRSDASPTADGLLNDYNAAIDALVNGTTILHGDRLAYAWFHANISELSDQVHPTNLGAEHLATMQATAEAVALGLITAVSSGGGTAVFKPLRGGLIGRAK